QEGQKLRIGFRPLRRGAGAGGPVRRLVHAIAEVNGRSALQISIGLGHLADRSADAPVAPGGFTREKPESGLENALSVIGGSISARNLQW
ncbi:MAG TPA: hypothetical protein DDY91_00390, partial [Planctomycetaceae bacterium]|nr:hypothetical protein [Planctomycetaceae bacterium]